MMRTFLFSFVMMLGFLTLNGQTVLQIERSGSSHTVKLSPGVVLQFRLKDDPVWYSGELVRLIPEDGLVVFHNRYVRVDQIEAFRRSLDWPAGLGRNLFWFGVGWSGFALVGTATDGIPETTYEWSDVVVSSTAVATSWLLPRIVKHKVTRFGKKRRLRILDLSPVERN